jgi:membrane-bound metal-dependent hydrolase YbcI (DUF457 family)
MRGLTHLAGGLCAAAVIIHTSDATWSHAIAGIAVSSVAALVPDWINVAVPGLRIRGATGHRGFTHWLLTAAITTTIVAMVAYPLAQFWMAGYLSHLVLDMLTERGIPIFGPLGFWPLPMNISLLPVHEGGLFDKWLGAALIVVAAMMIITR